MRDKEIHKVAVLRIAAPLQNRALPRGEAPGSGIQWSRTGPKINVEKGSSHQSRRQEESETFTV